MLLVDTNTFYTRQRGKAVHFPESTDDSDGNALVYTMEERKQLRIKEALRVMAEMNISHRLL